MSFTVIPLGRLIPMPTSSVDVRCSRLEPEIRMLIHRHKPPHVPADADQAAELASLPVQNPHAAGIDVGDVSHWVCVGNNPEHIREFPAHTRGLRALIAWLRECGVTTVALEASGVYGHVLFLSLLEAGVPTIITAPQFTRQIKGRPKTDRLDCQWIYRLHTHGLLPSIFQPDDATQTLRDLVRQRANLVRLSSHHIQRVQKALELMNLKLSTVVDDVTGQTGLKILRAILAGERDPQTLATLRDRRCKKTEAEIATALEGRYRDEHVLELRCCFHLWEEYLKMIAEVDAAIAAQLRTMTTSTALPPLPKRKHVRGRRPHDPQFDVRTALYRMTGIDLTELEGLDEMNALTLVSELGTDMTKWPTVKHFTSWLGLCPNVKKTGGKVQLSKTRRGKGRAAYTFRLAAWSLLRSKSYLGASLRRKRGQLGAPKAITATAHKLARIFYTVMRYGVAYQKRSEAEFVHEHQQRMERNLHRRAKELGYELKKIEPQAAARPSSSSE
jgi:transposase